MDSSLPFLYFIIVALFNCHLFVFDTTLGMEEVISKQVKEVKLTSYIYRYTVSMYRKNTWSRCHIWGCDMREMFW